MEDMDMEGRKHMMKHKKSVRRSMKHKSNPKSRKSCDVRNMLWLKKSSDKKAHCRKKHNKSMHKARRSHRM